ERERLAVDRRRRHEPVAEHHHHDRCRAQEVDVAVPRRRRPQREIPGPRPCSPDPAPRVHGAPLVAGCEGTWPPSHAAALGIGTMPEVTPNGAVPPLSSPTSRTLAPGTPPSA